MVAGKGKGDPPPILKTLWQSQRLNMPLKSGSLYEQPYEDLYTMEFLNGVYSKVEAWRKGPKNEEVQAAILYLTKLGVMNG